jgi:hypothetical protein
MLHKHTDLDFTQMDTAHMKLCWNTQSAHSCSHQFSDFQGIEAHTLPLTNIKCPTAELAQH